MKLIYGDCSEELKKIQGESISLILADPPFFNPATHYISRDTKKSRRSYEDMSIMKIAFKGIIQEISRIMKPKGHFLMFCDCITYPTFFECAYNYFDYTRALIWYKGKNYFSLGRGAWRYSYEMLLHAFNKNQFYVQLNRQDMIECKNVPQNRRFHQAEKPIKLLKELILAVTQENDIVCDPFMGGGTTGLACKELKRKFIGIELNKSYYDISTQRINRGIDGGLK